MLCWVVRELLPELRGERPLCQDLSVLLSFRGKNWLGEFLAFARACGLRCLDVVLLSNGADWHQVADMWVIGGTFYSSRLF
jgi:hypothetical protein